MRKLRNQLGIEVARAFDERDDCGKVQGLYRCDLDCSEVSAAPRSLDVSSRAKGYCDFIDANVEAEALGFHPSFVQGCPHCKAGRRIIVRVDRWLEAVERLGEHPANAQPIDGDLTVDQILARLGRRRLPAEGVETDRPGPQPAWSPEGLIESINRDAALDVTPSRGSTPSTSRGICTTP